MSATAATLIWPGKPVRYTDAENVERAAFVTEVVDGPTGVVHLFVLVPAAPHPVLDVPFSRTRKPGCWHLSQRRPAGWNVHGEPPFRFVDLEEEDRREYFASRTQRAPAPGGRPGR